VSAFEVWLTRPELGLSEALHDAFDELAAGLPSLGGQAADCDRSGRRTSTTADGVDAEVLR
jgi:hypothetical protein